jgi:hypothetical protein
MSMYMLRQNINPEDGGIMFLRNVTTYRLHNVASQKAVNSTAIVSKSRHLATR